MGRVPVEDRIAKLELALNNRLEFLRKVTLATKLQEIRRAKSDVERLREKIQRLKSPSR